jgi:predicted nucleic acid-binding protein
MSLYIVDACVAVKWYLPEEETASALRVASGLNELHVPDFFFIETDNILCKHIRRGLITPEQGSEFRRLLRQVPMKIHAVGEYQNEAFDTAVRTGRSMYDCLYMALAVLLDGQMVTADRRFHRSLATGPFRKHVVWVGDID